MPPTATSRSHTAIVESVGKATEVPNARRSQGRDDWQNVGGKCLGFGRLNLSPKRGRFSGIGAVAELGA